MFLMGRNSLLLAVSYIVSAGAFTEERKPCMIPKVAIAPVLVI
jgi:hypothetical protein